jgi:hypothetical protein
MVNRGTVAALFGLIVGVISLALGVGLSLVYGYCCFGFLALNNWKPYGLLRLARPPYIGLALISSGIVALLGAAGRTVARYGNHPDTRTSVTASALRFSKVGLSIGGTLFVISLFPYCTNWLW